MKKDQLKKVLKPLIKECIREAIFEEGVLSGLISEVVQGLGGQVISEAPRQATATNDFSRTANIELQQESQRQLEERKRKLEESLGGGAFSGIFENTEPLAKGGTPSENSGGAASPLSAYAPNDPGVDISGLMNIAGGQNWKKMI